MTPLTEEQQKRLAVFQSRNQAACSTLVAASQTSMSKAAAMIMEGDIDEALELCEKTTARIEGAAMAIQRLHQDL